MPPLAEASAKKPIGRIYYFTQEREIRESTSISEPSDLTVNHFNCTPVFCVCKVYDRSMIDFDIERRLDAPSHLPTNDISLETMKLENLEVSR